MFPPLAGGPPAAEVRPVPTSSRCPADPPAHCSQARPSGVPASPHPVRLCCGHKGDEWDLPARGIPVREVGCGALSFGSRGRRDGSQRAGSHSSGSGQPVHGPSVLAGAEEGTAG